MDYTVLYLKADLNVIVQNEVIRLRDVVKLYGVNEALIKQIGEREIFKITDHKKAKYAVTILKVIEAIQKEYPDTLIFSVGESDFVVEYLPKTKKKKIWELAKTILVGLAVFFGSSFTIMTFNQDVNVKEVLELFHHLVMGDSDKGLMVLQISYSLGLPIGIMIFFNHFTKFKMDTDPTPLQVQLRLYEKNENKAIIVNASREGNTIDVK